MKKPEFVGPIEVETFDDPKDLLWSYFLRVKNPDRTTKRKMVNEINWWTLELSKIEGLFIDTLFLAGVEYDVAYENLLDWNQKLLKKAKKLKYISPNQHYVYLKYRPDNWKELEKEREAQQQKE